MASRSVLIVEDEWLVRMELVDAFEMAGFSVIESASAEHGFELFRSRDDIALLVTDIRLSGVQTGWDLASRTRNEQPELPVIYLSANPPSDEHIVEGGVFIDKPALMDMIVATAMNLLDRKH